MALTLTQSLNFVESQAASIEPRVRMLRRGSIQYPDLVGITREANPHADSIVYYSYDGTGTMIDVANRASDIPLVDVSEQQHTVGIHWKALAYDWSDREIGRAELMGTPLSDRKVRLAFRIAEEEKEKVFLEGDASKGWDGILNHSSIPGDDATHTFENATDKQIAEMIGALISGVSETTNQSRMCDTLLLPVKQFNKLTYTPMGDDAGVSVMRWIRDNNPYTSSTGNPLMIRTVRQLKNAHNGNQDRAIAYPRDMEVLRFHVPQELQFGEAQRQGLTWTYYGSMVLAGLEIMEPSAMRYLNNI